MSPNANYNAGRAFEYKRKKFWTEQGRIVLRTAGSHGLFDLITIHPSQPTVFIQCKRVGKASEADKLLRDFQNNPPLTPSRYFHQRMEVQVKGSSEVLSVEV